MDENTPYLLTAPERAEQSRPAEPDDEAYSFYSDALRVLTDSRVPFMVGGAYALGRYTGISRHTKDLDIFVRRNDCPAILQVLAIAGYRTELTFPHWLAKAFHGDYFVDVIFSGGNGITTVDSTWFANAIDDEMFGVEVKLCPPEEMIWSKGFIMERERFDGADVLHLLRSQARRLDWRRLLARFDQHWRVLLSHLVLFGFVYPDERDLIPAGVMLDLVRRLQHDTGAPRTSSGLCRGTILSREQYLGDIGRDRLIDARLKPIGNMSPEEAAIWTEAIGHRDTGGRR